MSSMMLGPNPMLPAERPMATDDLIRLGCRLWQASRSLDKVIVGDWSPIYRYYAGRASTSIRLLLGLLPEEGLNDTEAERLERRYNTRSLRYLWLSLRGHLLPLPTLEEAELRFLARVLRDVLSWTRSPDRPASGPAVVQLRMDAYLAWFILRTNFPRRLDGELIERVEHLGQPEHLQLFSVEEIVAAHSWRVSLRA